jgi:putative oxidoreductase
MLADLAILVGRVALAIIFLTSGWSKLTGFSGTVSYLASLGAPSPTGAAVAAIVAELVGSLCVIFGFYTRLAAAGLALFTAVATYLAHQYWTYPVDEQAVQYIFFWKNIAMIGGLILLATTGGGRFALSRLLR